jgi:radical SAM protein with 4Fe4S-binding SPASM domain
MITKEEIRNSLEKFKIKSVQFDLNGFCNSKCWFCPVKYEPQPLRQNMPIKDVEKILDNIILEKGKMVDDSFHHIFTAHYNEIVLYPYFEDYLRMLEERNLYTSVLTNGVSLTPKVSDIISKYKNTVVGIHFNIPAIEKDEWSRQTGFHVNLHEKLILNIRYLIDHSELSNNKLSLVINGFKSNSFYGSGGWVEKLDNFPTFPNSVLGEQELLFKEYFPEMRILPNEHIVDRDGIMEKHNIYSLSKAVNDYNKKSLPLGCRNGSSSFKEGELTGRIYGWLHINSLGELFLCCQDYEQNTKFGNILETSIRDVWFSDKHVDVIHNELNNGMCINCNYTEWK